MVVTTLRIVLLLSLAILFPLLTVTILKQGEVIEQQRALIHAMQSNPACMGAQPVKAPEPLPYTYRAIMGMVPNPPMKRI